MIEYNGYSIQQDGMYSMCTIRPLGKGSVPKELRGRYTDYGAAKKAIDAYVKSKSKGQYNGKTERSS